MKKLTQEEFNNIMAGHYLYNMSKINNPIVNEYILKCNHGVLQKANFTNCEIDGIDMRGLDLKEVSFNGSKLKNIDMLGSNISAAEFRFTVLENVKFNGVTAFFTEFQGANFKSCSYTSSMFCKAKFDGTDLYEEKIKNCNFAGVKFYGSNLGYTVFKDTNIKDSKFDKCNLSGMVVSGGMFRNNEFSDIVRYCSMDVPKPKLNVPEGKFTAWTVGFDTDNLEWVHVQVTVSTNSRILRDINGRLRTDLIHIKDAVRTDGSKNKPIKNLKFYTVDEVIANKTAAQLKEFDKDWTNPDGVGFRFTLDKEDIDLVELHNDLSNDVM